MPEWIKKYLVLENDDKTFMIQDVLKASQIIKKQTGQYIPVVLDVHHYNCKNNGEKPNYELIAETWKWTGKKPKIHLSSPKGEGRDFRTHAEYIDFDYAKPIFDELNEADFDADVMMEAPGKDLAVEPLVEWYKNSYLKEE